MFRGAEILYGQFVRPVFLRNQPAIDAQASRFSVALCRGGSLLYFFLPCYLCRLRCWFRATTPSFSRNKALLAAKLVFVPLADEDVFPSPLKLYASNTFLRTSLLLQFERLQGASTVIRNVIGFDPLARPEGNGAGACLKLQRVACQNLFIFRFRRTI